jgi:putative spermidine/putrescine transport system substrate-binding protein
MHPQIGASMGKLPIAWAERYTIEARDRRSSASLLSIGQCEIQPGAACAGRVSAETQAAPRSLIAGRRSYPATASAILPLEAAASVPHSDASGDIIMPSTRRRLLAASLSAPLSLPFIRRAHAARSITFAAYSGIFQENYEPAVVDAFRKAHPGIDVTYYPVANSAQLLGLLRAQKSAPQIDVCMLDVSVAKTGTDEALFEPIAPRSMPVLAELTPKAFIPGVAGPAVLYDNFVLLYAPPQVKPDPTSWKTLWDPAYDGKIAIAAAPDIVGISFTLIANAIHGGDYRQSVEAGVAAITEMAPRVLTWDPKPDAYTFLIEGTAALAVGWNARGQTYAKQSGGRLGVAIPDEGSLFQVNSINLVKNTREPEAARTFLAYTLGAEAQKAFTERMFYGPVNTTAQISPDALARTAATPERLAKMVDVDWIAVSKMRDAITDQWRRRILRAR